MDHYKYLKYKEKYLKAKKMIGGGYQQKCYNDNDNTLVRIFNGYKNCNSLLSKIYVNCLVKNEYMDYDKYVVDPFFETFKEIDVTEWYKTFNPNFVSLKNINPRIKEYEYFIAGIVKDYFITLVHNIWPDMKIFNETLTPELVSEHKLTMKLQENLEQLDKTIKDGFHYNDVISCIMEYLIFYQAKHNNRNVRQCNIPFFTEDSPFLIYPSFHQPNYWKSLLLYSAPIINVYIVNHNHNSHDQFKDICYEVSHDIRYHYQLVLNSVAKLYNVRLSVGIPEGIMEDEVTNVIDDRIKALLYVINRNPIPVIKFYNTMNEILTKVKPYVIYKKFVIVDDGQYNSDYSCSFLAYYLFYLFHESSFIYMITTTDLSELINYKLFCLYIYTFPLSFSYKNTKYIISHCEKKIGGIKSFENIISDMIVPAEKDLLHIQKQIDNLIAYYNKIFNNEIMNKKPDLTINSPVEEFRKYDEYVSLDFKIIDYEFKMGLLSNYYKKPIKEGPTILLPLTYLRDHYVFSEANDVYLTPENQKLICNFIHEIPKHINKIIHLILPPNFKIKDSNSGSNMEDFDFSYHLKQRMLRN